MKHLFVVEEAKDWPESGSDIPVVSARDYINSEEYRSLQGTRVYNLCRSYRYQSLGYYVSLLAAARGQKPAPSVNSLQDMKSLLIIRSVSDNLGKLIQKSLQGIRSDRFELSIYFGKNVASKYDELARELSRSFHAPLIRAFFKFSKDKWYISRIYPISLNDVPESHRPFLFETANAHFKKRQLSARIKTARFSLAILRNINEVMSPSNEKAIQKFTKAAARHDIETEIIDASDIAHLAEFDGLFIRETTEVNHHTFRFAQKAQALGLVTIDDPDSILKCTNKVYLAELLARHKLPAPKTILLDRTNVQTLEQTLKYPCILKKPDSAFSVGVVKVNDSSAFRKEAEALLETTELGLIQEFVPTDFDWRVGVIDKKPLFLCKYYMARGHWQIYKQAQNGKLADGHSETLDVRAAPPGLIELALRASALIGNGFYGLDIKQFGDRFKIIEINDNPSVDAGVEDAVLKDSLYDRIMQVFLDRMMKKVEGK